MNVRPFEFRNSKRWPRWSRTEHRSIIDIGGIFLFIFYKEKITNEDDISHMKETQNFYANKKPFYLPLVVEIRFHDQYFQEYQFYFPRLNLQTK